MLASQKIWNAMRILKRFDFVTLQIVSEAHRNTIKNYIWGLKRIGYIKEISKDNFLLLKNTGPKRLKFNRNGNKIVSIFDPNIPIKLIIKKDNLSNVVKLEEFIEQKKSFKVEDIASIFSSKAVAKACLHRLVKFGKVLKINEVKEGSNWIAIYKYNKKGGNNE